METKLTEKQFISKFKKHGFELYKTKDLKPKIDIYNKLKDIFTKDVENGENI